ncbi:MAG: alpha-amylase [Actinobacteria bacterium]|nr:alpha-amylase [Actinomycetota bacterium]
MASPGETRQRPRWWAGAVGYEIYIRSFNDASGDGIGDLEGLRRRLAYLADLGVDYLWITPFYPSPQADHGYDVADYTDVDPVYGTLADFDGVVRDAHALGLRVIIDIVPNHTSNQHPWFRDAVTSRHADKRGYYVWRAPAPDGGPPNNWVSKFGGPAWTLHEATGQYYMHTFLPEQPDLNWSSVQVLDEFDAILRFWLDRGVDGFRVDTAHLLTEDPHYRDNPQRTRPPESADPETVYHSFEHRFDLDQPDVLDVYRRWHRILQPYNAMLLGEVYLLQPTRVLRYVVDDALDLAFYFPTLKATWNAASIRDALVPAASISQQRFAWPLSSHDDPRATQRFGGGPVGARRALAYLTLLSGLPGSPCLLQGDELGLHADDLPSEHLQDPIATRNSGTGGRDRSRTPMPWSARHGYGFTTGTPWMPFPSDASAADPVATQRRDHGSPLHRTRRLLTLRRQLRDLHGDTPLHWLNRRGPVIAYQRGTTVVALNTADRSQVLDTGGTDVDVRYASEGTVTVVGGRLHLPPDTAAIATRCP